MPWVFRITIILSADQFSLRGDAGFQGDAFASALASSCDDATRDSDSDAQPWPKWATELRRPRGGSVAEAPADEVQLLVLPTDGAATVRVTNVFRSWDRFYATVLPASGADDAAFQVAPVCGDLAPRGGANNVCDESKPYRDHVDITIARRAGDARTAQAMLLVRTEEEQWIWRIVEDGDLGGDVA